MITNEHNNGGGGAPPPGKTIYKAICQRLLDGWAAAAVTRDTSDAVCHPCLVTLPQSIPAYGRLVERAQHNSHSRVVRVSV